MNYKVLSFFYKKKKKNDKHEDKKFNGFLESSICFQKENRKMILFCGNSFLLQLNQDENLTPPSLLKMLCD
jgi:hypothetical protein